MRQTAMPVLVLAVLWVTFATDRMALYQRMGEEGKELYRQYRQFMTEGQEEEFLALETDPERRAYVAQLRVEERLARFSPEVRAAILERDVLLGMDEEAVLLAWGRPEQVEHLTEGERAGQAIWYYPEMAEAGRPPRPRVVYLAAHRVVEVTK